MSTRTHFMYKYVDRLTMKEWKKLCTKKSNYKNYLAISILAKVYFTTDVYYYRG